MKIEIESGYICRDCATKHGAKWPYGHAATCHSGKCCGCGEMKRVCHTSDWNWPRRPELSRNREL